MGVMMLDGDETEVSLLRMLLRPAGGEIAGVQIVDDDLRFDFEGVREVSKGMLEELEASRVLQISEMLALVGKSATSEGEDVFQMAPYSEHGRSIQRQWDGQRDVSSGATNELRRFVDDSGHGVIAALQNLAIVHQECVRDIAETGPRFLVVDGNGLFAKVRGGHDKSLDAGIGEKQMLERSIREVDTQPGDSRRNGRCDAIGRSGLREDDGTCRSLQQGFFSGGQLTERLCRGKITDHHGERLAIAMLPLSQPRDGGFAGCVDGKMEAADALDGEDVAAQ